MLIGHLACIKVGQMMHCVLQPERSDNKAELYRVSRSWRRATAAGRCLCSQRNTSLFHCHESGDLEMHTIKSHMWTRTCGEQTGGQRKSWCIRLHVQEAKQQAEKVKTKQYVFSLLSSIKILSYKPVTSLEAA